MIEKGMVWWKTQNIDSVVSIERMKKVQEQAKDTKQGLWLHDNPVPPWEWRKNRKDVEKQ